MVRNLFKEFSWKVSQGLINPVDVHASAWRWRIHLSRSQSAWESDKVINGGRNSLMGEAGACHPWSVIWLRFHGALESMWKIDFLLITQGKEHCNATTGPMIWINGSGHLYIEDEVGWVTGRCKHAPPLCCPIQWAHIAHVHSLLRHFCWEQPELRCVWMQYLQHQPHSPYVIHISGLNLVTFLHWPPRKKEKLRRCLNIGTNVSPLARRWSRDAVYQGVMPPFKTPVFEWGVDLSLSTIRHMLKKSSGC